jgi:hypothetical protein
MKMWFHGSAFVAEERLMAAGASAHEMVPEKFCPDRSERRSVEAAPSPDVTRTSDDRLAA